MVEKLKEWRELKGKSTGKIRLQTRQNTSDATVKKPLRTTNSVMTQKNCSSTKNLPRSLSTTKKKPVGSAQRKLSHSPEISMREKVDMWKAQKEREKSVRKATKKSWMGASAPLYNKHRAKQTTTDAIYHSVQKKTNVLVDRFSSNKETKKTSIKVLKDVPLCTPSNDLCGTCYNTTSNNTSADRHFLPSVGLEQATETSKTDDTDEADMLDFSLEPMETSPIIQVFNTQYTNYSTPPHPSQARKNSESVSKSECKSALKPLSKMARLDKVREHRSVTFTTPLRCSPRLAKVGEKSRACDSTPRNKKDMREHLQQWLIEKGKTPSRYNNLLNFQKNTPADRIRRDKLKSRIPTPARSNLQSTREEDECNPIATDDVIDKMNATLSECLTLLQEGCPVDHVSHWLDDICRRLPLVEECAKYWLCRAMAAEIEGDYDEVIGVFEEAAEAGAQPVEEIKEGLKALVLRIAHKRKILPDPTPSLSSAASPSLALSASSSPSSQPIISSPEFPARLSLRLGHLTGLKYCLTDTTPLFNRIHKTLHRTPGLMITPVRRSARLESRRSFLPDSLQDHDICVSSLNDLPANVPTEFILRSNRALEEEFTDTDG